jgi:phosphoglycerol transferase MdoB-like AlkP superfamily enzyme
MTPALAAAMAAASFTPDTTVVKIRVFMLGLISLVLILITLSSLWGHARKGHTRQVWDVVGASLLALIPGALGVLGTGLAFAAAFLGWTVPYLTK